MYVGRQKCGSVRYNPKELYYVIQCNGKVGNYVKVIHRYNYLHMAEVQVYGGSKGVSGLGILSDGKPTKASSVGWGGISDKAVDGNVDGFFGHKTSYCSKGTKDNWWQVDLEKDYPVYTVLVHNRVDTGEGIKARIDGAQVRCFTSLGY